MDIVSACASPEEAVSLLMTESRRRWRQYEPVVDDTTILVAFLNEKGAHAAQSQGMHVEEGGSLSTDLYRKPLKVVAPSRVGKKVKRGSIAL